MKSAPTITLTGDQDVASLQGRPIDLIENLREEPNRMIRRETIVRVTNRNQCSYATRN